MLHAHESGGLGARQLVMKQAIAEVAGKQILMVIMPCAPSQVSEAHTLPRSVDAYVLEGTALSQLGGQAPKTRVQGESRYEPPTRTIWSRRMPARRSQPSCARGLSRENPIRSRFRCRPYSYEALSCRRPPVTEGVYGAGA